MTFTESPQQVRRLGRRRVTTAAVIIVAVLGITIGLLVAQPWKPPPLLAPVGVGAGAPTATSVRVSWKVAPGSLTPEGFLVLRDGAQVASTAGTALSYVDRGLTPGSAYTYAIVATAGDQRSKVSPAVAATTTAPAPTRLAQTGRDYSSVTLTWSAPPGAPAPDYYQVVDVSHGDAVIAAVNGHTRAYTVPHLQPGDASQYDVDAVWSGNASRPTAAVTAAARMAPLDHDYAVTYKTVAVPGGGASLHVGQTWSDQWSFTPVCSGSTCSAMRAVLNFDPPNYVQSEIDMTLRLSGGSYVGTTTSKVTTCGGTQSTSILTPSIDPPTEVTNTVSLAVAPAKSSSGAWTAWRAVMQLSSPYTVHHPTISLNGQVEVCPAQSWGFTATGHPSS